MYIYVPHVVLNIFAPIALIVLFLWFTSAPLWLNAYAAGVKNVSIAALIGMRLRKVPPERIVNPLIAAVLAGVDVNVNQLETHYLAKGSVDQVVKALISARRANVPLTFQKAAMLDLQGDNVLEAVQMSVTSNNLDPRLR